MSPVHQWRHGWVPLTPAALAVKLHKAHGSARGVKDPHKFLRSNRRYRAGMSHGLSSARSDTAGTHLQRSRTHLRAAQGLEARTEEHLHRGDKASALHTAGQAAGMRLSALHERRLHTQAKSDDQELGIIRESMRREMAQTARAAHRELERVGGRRLRVTKGGEADFLKGLSKAERNRLSTRFLTHDPTAPGADEVSDSIRQAHPDIAGHDQAMEWWLNQTRTADAAGAMARGKLPAGGYGGGFHPDQLQQDAYQPSRVFGERSTAVAHVRKVASDEKDMYQGIGTRPMVHSSRDESHLDAVAFTREEAEVQTIDLATHHWKHGWIPLTPEALAIKLHRAHGHAGGPGSAHKFLHSHEDYRRGMRSGLRGSKGRTSEALRGDSAKLRAGAEDSLAKGDRRGALRHAGIAAGLEMAARHADRHGVQTPSTPRRQRLNDPGSRLSEAEQHARDAGKARTPRRSGMTGAESTAALDRINRGSAVGSLERKPVHVLKASPAPPRRPSIIEPAKDPKERFRQLVRHYDVMHGRPPTAKQQAKLRKSLGLSAERPGATDLAVPVETSGDGPQVVTRSGGADWGHGYRPRSPRAVAKKAGKSTGSFGQEGKPVAQSSIASMLPDEAACRKAAAKIGNLPPKLRAAAKARLRARAQQLGISLDLSRPGQVAVVGAAWRNPDGSVTPAGPELVIPIDLATLSTKARKGLSKGDFAIPESRSYPIHDRSHAANAIARVRQHGSPSEKRRVLAAVRRKYPDMGGAK